MITVDRVIDIGLGFHPSLALQFERSSPLYGLLESVFFVIDRTLGKFAASLVG